LVLAHGFLGAGPHFTAVFLITITALLFLLSPRRRFEASATDILYAALLLVVCVAFLINGRTADVRETILFGLTLAAYPAARIAPTENRAIFIWTTITVVALGTVVTATALVEQWASPHGKPFVFGKFDAAPIQFLTSLGFAVVAAACSKLTPRKTLIICALLFVPATVFGASQVRFTFVAIESALVFGALIGRPSQRKYLFSIIAALAFACVFGLIMRPAATMNFTSHFVSSVTGANEKGPDVPQKEMHTECASVDHDNSISLRAELLKQAFRSLPGAGLFGHGLDGFFDQSCFGGTLQIHNSFLQAVIEFGWVGGALFVFLIVSVTVTLLPLARYDDEVRFVLSGLLFMVLESAAHGRLSRDGVLFAFLGYGAGLTYRLLKTSPMMEGDKYHLRPIEMMDRTL
jgi:hypothetical protein